ncbi:MAG: class I SAM-dependent methyltransferase [Thermodesulfobacteriota bacterium]
MTTRKCRHCDTPLRHSFADLRTSPLANSYLTADDLHRMEPFYPLHALVCDKCLLVQLEHSASPQEIFSHYLYFSSYSDSWLSHASAYADLMTASLSLGRESLVIEIGSNDGYLLRFFQQKGIPVLGIEPAGNVAAVARERGIDTRVEFFGQACASALTREGKLADLVVGNNVLAHVPDINDFVKGLTVVLRPGGVATMEFPHLLRLMEQVQFDTIYHEHFFYFSLLAVDGIFRGHGLAIYDVEELPTHGGSLRIYARHATDCPGSGSVSPRVSGIIQRERQAGLHTMETYATFSEKVKETKRRLLECLIRIKAGGKSIVAYGAPAKGNTLLNYCGIGTDFLDYTVDRSPHKQGHYLPGTRIPIHHPDRIRETQPDYVLILPWNLTEEISQQMAHIRDWGGMFIVPIPEPLIF